jgi:ribonuclease-3 family protein
VEKFFPNLDCDYKNMSSNTFAFLGDGIFEIFVREELVCKFPNHSLKELNKLKTERVCCQAQSDFLKKILSNLTEEETIICKRGRNAHTSHLPKNATTAQYHEATALECLLGYLYLKGDVKRLQELLSINIS